MKRHVRVGVVKEFVVGKQSVVVVVMWHEVNRCGRGGEAHRRRGDCGELFSFCCKGVAVFFLRGVFLEEPGIIRADVRMPETKCGDVAFIAEVSMVEMLLRYLEGTEPFSLE